MNSAGHSLIKNNIENTSGGYLFLPSPRLKLLYLSYLFFVVWAVIMPVLMVISITFPTDISLPVSIAALLVVLLALAWIRKYYGSVRYYFNNGQITRYNGVLSKKTTSISCDQVHRVSTRRGPFQRLFGITTVDLLTTDPTASSGSHILMSISGVAKPEALEQMIDACRTGKFNG
jgi:membrane protein YdbS with pleckstrin-like domain